MWKPCKHKTGKDHSEEFRDFDDKLLYIEWTCSNCGKQDKWRDTWSYWGNIECSECDMSKMDWVACSDECADKLKG